MYNIFLYQRSCVFYRNLAGIHCSRILAALYRNGCSTGADCRHQPVAVNRCNRFVAAAPCHGRASCGICLKLLRLSLIGPCTCFCHIQDCVLLVDGKQSFYYSNLAFCLHAVCSCRNLCSSGAFSGYFAALYHCNRRVVTFPCYLLACTDNRRQKLYGASCAFCA